MSKPKKADAATDERTPFERFQQVTRALFRVDKRDVLKHEPKKRERALRQNRPSSE